MGNGFWNNNGATPAPPCAWSKVKLGWISPEVIEMDGSWQWISAFQPYRQIKVIIGEDLGLYTDEYFLLEVINQRPFTAGSIGPQVSSFNQPLPLVSSGVAPDFGQILITHVDENKRLIANNDVNQLDEDSGTDHYRVAITQADGLFDLENFSVSAGTGNTGDQGDLWPKSILGNFWEMGWTPLTGPNTDSYYPDYLTQIHVNKMQPGKTGGVTINDVSWIRWVDYEDGLFNSQEPSDSRWRFYCPEKNVKDPGDTGGGWSGLAELILLHPNGYHTQYPTRSPNGKVYGDYEDIYNEVVLRRVGVNDIIWDYSSATGDTVMIELYKTGSPLLTITAGTPNDGYFEWVITPQQTELIPAGTDYLVKITDLTDSSVYDYSDDYLTIDDSNPMIRITNTDISETGMVVDDPSDTEVWRLTWTTNINSTDTWTDTVQIDIYHGGSLLMTAGTATAGTGGFIVDFGALGLPLDTGYQFKISFVGRPEVYYLSELFHLHYSAPDMTNIVVDKNAIYQIHNGTRIETASILVTGLPSAVTMIHLDRSDTSVPNYDFELYQDDLLVREITSEVTVEDSRTFLWEFPLATFGDNLRIMIIDINDRTDFNLSDPFAILPPNFIIAPNGGDHFNKWSYLPFGQFEYTGNYNEVNIWFGSSLPERKKPTDPPFTFSLQYADASVEPLIWASIPGADSIEPFAAVYNGDLLVCSSGNFVWDVPDTMTLEKCLIRIVTNEIGPYQDVIDTPIVIDHTLPAVVETIVWNTDGNAIEAANAFDVSVKTAIVLKFNKPMDRFDLFHPYSGFQNAYSWFWPLSVVDDSGTQISGTVVWENTELHLYPEYDLDPFRSYTVTIDVDARDNYGIGNFIDGAFSFTFMTGDLPVGGGGGGGGGGGSLLDRDTDGDGMPDWYEYENRWPTYHYKYDTLTYGYDWFDSVTEGLKMFIPDANEDYDGDGITNLEAFYLVYPEYEPGTPDTPDTPVASIASMSDTETMISWDSAGTPAGTKYNVWYADDPGGPWQLLPGGPYNETGGIIDVIDVLPPGTTRRFYKVEAYI